MICDLSELNRAIAREDNAYINCDCMEAMKRMPDKCIDLCICDPVYGGGDARWLHERARR